MKPIEIRSKKGAPPPELPFTEEEMYRAYRLAFPESQARELAAAWAAIPEDVSEGRSIGYGLAEATLLLLSLISPDLHDRVKSFLGLGGMLQEGEWEGKVQEMRKHLEAEQKL